MRRLSTLLLLIGAVVLWLSGRGALWAATSNDAGLIGTVATKQTIAYLGKQTGFKTNPSALRRTIHYDAYLGSDTNPGTEDQPRRSFGDAKAQCTTYTRCVFKAGRIWSPKTWVIAGTLLDASEQFVVGETLSYDRSSSTARVLDWQIIDDTGYLVTEDLTGSTLVAGDEVSGSASGTVLTMPAVVDNITAATQDIVPDASEEYDDNIVILYEGSLETTDQSKWPKIHCNKTGPAFPIFGSTASTGGWLGVQRIVVQSCPEDAVSQSGSGKIIAMNFVCKEARNIGGDLTNNCFTSHGAGQLIFVNTSSHGISNSSSGGSPLAFVDGGTRVLGINFEATVETTVAGQTNQPIVVHGSDITLVNGRLAGVHVDASYWNAVLTNNQGAFRGNFAYVLFEGDGANAIGLQLDGSGAHLFSFFARNITVARSGRCLSIGNVNPAITAYVDMRRIVCDQLFSYGILASPNSARWSADLEGVFDQDDSALGMTYWINDAQYFNLNDARTAMGATINAFENNSADSGGIGTNGDQFGGMPGGACVFGKECWKEDETAYELPLPVDMVGHVPPELIDGQTKVTGFLLGEDGDGYIDLTPERRSSCGLGPELALLVPALSWLRRRP